MEKIERCWEGKGDRVIGRLDRSPLLRRILGGAASDDDSGAAADSGGYSKPLVIIDVVWNVAFVVVSVAVLLTTLRERPSTPLRVWVVGYAAQCLIHVALVLYEFGRRRSGACCGCEGSDCGGGIRMTVVLMFTVLSVFSISKRIESMNTMGSFFWWLMGFYWIVLGGHTLIQDAPRLYWLSVVFLAFDVFFAVFCAVLACIVGIALCCCLPCIVAILYAMAVQEGASDADIMVLPKYRFRLSDQRWASHLDTKQEVRVAIMETDSSQSSEIFLPSEDSECCICLSRYVDGVELQSLPCNHHFHSECICKWLRINATCPLCKHNILHGDELV
ncbi:hypothetical protein Sjap_012173 [Stephania japonica]|uniref:RING-type E3 ubiquitin transferase n=1 Tax=Stephania japonica TaxID=461633 RepID=A0AAP0IVI4_9MAGN